MPIRTFRAAALAAALLVPAVLPAGAAAQVEQQPPQQQPVLGAVVDAVEVSGNRRVPIDQILERIGMRQGDTVLTADIDQAMRRLLATGQFRDVQVFAQEDPANPVRVTFRFVVDEHPVIAQIDFRGLENVRASVIRDTVGLRVGQPYDPARAVRAEAMTRTLLAARGFRVLSIGHRVEPVSADRPDELALIFDVEEGQRVAITEIEFEGNETFSDERLRDVMGTRTEGFLWFRSGVFDEETLRNDLRGSLPAFYASNGFIDFNVVGDSLVVDEETGKGRLIIRVDEGQQYTLADFDVRGASRFPSAELRRFFEQRRTGLLAGFGLGGVRDEGTRAGEVFDAVAFDAATNDVRQLYQNQGYLYSQVNPVIERVPSVESGGSPQVRVAWEIVEGNPASVRRVNIIGNTFTHEDVIRNAIFVLPGDIYSQDLLIRSYRSITATGFFETDMPEPRIEPTETGDVDITFEVREKQTGSVQFGTSLGGTLGLMGFLGYDQPNLFGQAKAGHLRWEFGRYSNNFEASYTDPAIAGSWISGGVSLFSSTDRFYTFSEGRRRRTGAALRTGVPLPWDRRYSRFNIGYSLSRTSYENFQDDTENLFSLPPGVQSTVTMGVTRMALDHPLFPTVGSRQEVEASLNGGPLGGDGNFQKYTLSSAWYVPVGTLGGNAPGANPIRFTLGLSLEGGALFGNATRFPFDRFFMGGVQFGRPLRGYEETTITPRGYIPEDVRGVPLQERFGDAYLRLSGEFAVRVSDNISLSTFYDAGNVWRDPSQMNPTRLMRGAGVGVMLVTPFGPLGLDYAYGFDKAEPGWHLHFKFGQGF